MEVRVKFFAVCKDYFDPEMMFQATNLEELKKVLIEKSPSFYTILQNCKFIIGKDEVEGNYRFNKEDLILILPPSSGG